MITTQLHDCFNYVDCDIPAGMSIAEWKRERRHGGGTLPPHPWLRRLHLVR
jgi:hypothetical protein